MDIMLKEINWNGGYYIVGGTVIHRGDVKIIKSLEIDVEQTGSSIFDRRNVLKVTTVDAEIIEIVERG